MPTTESLEMKITGMHCDACVRRVNHALAAVPGVTVKRVEIGSASMTYDPLQASPSAVKKAIEDIGFEIAS